MTSSNTQGREKAEARYEGRQSELPKGCKMKGGGRYASDDTCENCGLLEGEACALWLEISNERLKALQAMATNTPTPALPSNVEELRRCHRCKEDKPIEAFPWSSADIRKRLGICLKCYRRS